MPDLETLVLQAALLEPERAIDAWTQATQVEPIDDWPGELARPLPLVYLNLKGASEANHLALLRGVYRAAWSANMVRLRRALDVINELDVQGINYRLIKGAAVCSLTDNWAARRMGDIDLVIPQERTREVKDVLEAHAFEHQATDRSIDGLWKSADGGILDLHTTNTPILAQVLHAEPNVSTVLGSPLRIPSPEMSIALASHHAKLGHAASDYIQALLDVHRLLPLCASEDLVQTLERTNQGQYFVSLIDRLRAIGTDPERYVQAGDLRTLAQPSVSENRTSHRGVHNAARSMATRFESPWRLTRRVPHLRKSAEYLAWLTAGHPRLWEERIIRRAGGFLPLPSEEIPPNSPVLISPNNTVSQNATLSSIRIPGIEDRLRIRIPDCSWARIRLSPHPEVGTTSRMVFVNGIMHGYFPPFDAPSVAIDVTPINGSLEISLRLHKDASQDDFVLTLEMLKP